MRRSELIDFLIAETGGLRPDTGTTQTELTDLRSALLVAGDRGASTTPGSAQPHHAVDDALRSEFGYLVGRHVATAPLREPTIRLVRRGAPLPDTEDGSTPDWAVAVRPDRTLRSVQGHRRAEGVVRPVSACEAQVRRKEGRRSGSGCASLARGPTSRRRRTSRGHRAGNRMGCSTVARAGCAASRVGWSPRQRRHHQRGRSRPVHA